MWENGFAMHHHVKINICATSFYNQFLIKKYHHINAVVHDHEIKNRPLCAITKFNEGHFINDNDDSTLLHVDSYQ